MVRALASHQCSPGSIPRLGAIYGLSLLVLYSEPRGFLRVLRFLLSSKTYVELEIVNFSLQCPSSARTTRHLNKVPFFLIFGLKEPLNG